MVKEQLSNPWEGIKVGSSEISFPGNAKTSFPIVHSSVSFSSRKEVSHLLYAHSPDNGKEVSHLLHPKLLPIGFCFFSPTFHFSKKFIL